MPAPAGVRGLCGVPPSIDVSVGPLFDFYQMAENNPREGKAKRKAIENSEGGRGTWDFKEILHMRTQLHHVLYALRLTGGARGK